ncbi:MAG: translation initiation factor IF-3 [Puniceicoccales bacterium]
MPFSGGGRRPGGNRKRYQRNRGPRKNERIRVPEIRVIGPDGKQIGVMQTREALALAKNNGLDLIEISPTARPPVCRILDYGKYMYEQSKKEKETKAKAQNASSKLKEVKFRVRIEEHDYITKLKRGEKFLAKGSKLKMTLMFRGREMEHKDLGFDVIKRAVEDLAHIATADAPAKLVGRNITLTMSPLPANKRKLKYNVDLDEEDDDEDDEE